MTLDNCSFSHSSPSGYKCHTSVITVLIISQHGNDPACWQASVVSTSGLRHVQRSHVDPSSVPSMEMQIFVMWHLKLLCSGGPSCQPWWWLPCAVCLAENKSHHSWWLTPNQNLVWGSITETGWRFGLSPASTLFPALQIHHKGCQGMCDSSFAITGKPWVNTSLCSSIHFAYRHMHFNYQQAQKLAEVHLKSAISQRGFNGTEDQTKLNPSSVSRDRNFLV